MSSHTQRRRFRTHPFHGLRRLAALVALTCTTLGPLRAPAQEAAEIVINKPGHATNSIALQVWNDPDFKRRFAESYMAETEIEPRVTADEREDMLEILELISADEMGEAAEWLEKELAGNEAASAVLDFTLANIHFQQEHLDDAAAAYEKAVEKFPKFRRAWKNLGLIRIRQGKPETALPALTRVLELGGGDAVTYGLMGFAQASAGNDISAESAYRMAILLDPATLDWRMGLARSFFKQERHAEALALCRMLSRDAPDRVDLWLLQANAHIGLGQPLEAAEIFELLDEMGGSTVDSLNMLGDIYVNEELYGVAADAYLRAIRKAGGGKPDRAIRAARVLSARGALEETRTLVDAIEEVHGGGLENADRKELLKLRARIAVADGSGDEEVRVLREIVELDPLDGEALILLGQHSGREGDDEQAVFYYERAAGIEGFEADALVRHAQLLVRNGDYAEALPLLRRAQQIKPRDNIQEYLEQVERVARSR